MNKVLNSRGKPQASIKPSALRMRVIKLSRPETHIVCNAGMPTAPRDFKWPHLQTPSRFL